MEFEYDPLKSERNLEKHGIDFEEAQLLWDDDMVSFSTDRNGEKRLLGVGRIIGQYWTVIYVEKGRTVRLISARKSTAIERSAYDRQANR